MISSDFHADITTQLDDWLEFVIPEERKNVQDSWTQLCQNLSPQRLIMVSMLDSFTCSMLKCCLSQEFNFTSGRCVQAQVCRASVSPGVVS